MEMEEPTPCEKVTTYITFCRSRCDAELKTGGDWPPYYYKKAVKYHFTANTNIPLSKHQTTISIIENTIMTILK